jgi:hypothetical protein
MLKRKKKRGNRAGKSAGTRALNLFNMIKRGLSGRVIHTATIPGTYPDKNYMAITAAVQV